MMHDSNCYPFCLCFFLDTSSSINFCVSLEALCVMKALRGSFGKSYHSVTLLGFAL